MPELKNREGERNVNTRGLEMTIKAYRGCKDIDVEFKDGAVREHVAYGNFKRGSVCHPDDTAKAKARKRVGERRPNNQGRMMEVTACRGSHDIDVRFEDGSVRRGVQHTNFARGSVRHPDDAAKAKDGKRVGERRKNTQGRMMEITAYRSCLDMDVAFEDGQARKRVQYRNFKKGLVRHPDDMGAPEARKRIGERRVSNSGMLMEITAYRGCNDIDILFEDGAVCRHKRYGAFKRGKIRHPSGAAGPKGPA